MYHGDIRLGDTIDIKFTTRQSTGAPFTLAGTPVISAYPGNSTTQLTAGITLTADFDAVTGLNNVRVVATSGNGYATATNYALVITTGTVNSVSVVGEVIGTFSIEARSAIMPTTAARTLDVSATGEAGVDWANVGSPTTTVGLSGTTVATVTTATTATNVTTVNGLASGVVTAASIAASALNGKGDWNVGKTGYSLTATTGLGNQTADITGNLSGSVGSVTGAVGSVTGAVGSVTGLTTTTIADQVWDELLSGHVVSGSAGEALAAAGTAGDPWTTTLPGSYTGSQAGKMLSDILTDTAEIGTAGAGLTNINLPDQTMDITGNITGNLSGSVGSVTGAVASVTGAVGSVTGNVGGNVTGSVGSVATGGITSGSFAAGAIDAAAIAANAIGASELAADAVAEIAAGAKSVIGSGTLVAGTTSSLTLEGSVATCIAGQTAILITSGVAINEMQILATVNPGTGVCTPANNFANAPSTATYVLFAVPASVALTSSDFAANSLTASALAADAVAEIADGVWDEALSGHLGAGSTGEALNAAGSAGDPWTTTLPGSYTGSQAGKMLSDILTDTGTTLDAALAVVDANVDAILVDTGTTLDGNITAIKTKTDFLPSATAGAAGGVFIAGANAATSITTALTANITGNLSGSVGSVTGAVGSVTGAVGSVAGNVDGNVAGSVASVTAAVTLTSAYDFAKGTVAMTESYAADGATMTPAQAFYQIWGLAAEKSIAGTTLTAKKLDGSTAAMTFTLDDATTPTSITRAT